MRQLSLIVFLAIYTCFSLQLFAQESDRISVPGSKVSMVPPEGFELSNEFQGFIHLASSSAIQVTEHPGVNPAAMKFSFTEEVLEPQGITLEGKEEVKTNAGVPASLILVSFTVEGMDFERYIFITGDHNNMYIINANYPVMTKELIQDKMKESLLTVEF
ncbi:MAG: hypothetical protein WD048_11985 [Chitinophagales bacterium]